MGGGWWFLAVRWFLRRFFSFTLLMPMTHHTKGEPWDSLKLNKNDNLDYIDNPCPLYIKMYAMTARFNILVKALGCTIFTFSLL